MGIIRTEKGIIIVAGDDGVFVLPGGGANMFESRKRATMREIKEEISLDVNKIKHLFSYVGKIWKDKKGKLVRNHTKVFIVEVEGKPKMANEIRRIGYWKPGKKFNLTQGTKFILEKYVKEFDLI